MIPLIRTATTTGKDNVSFTAEPRKKGESNVAWLKRNLNEEKEPIRLILLGGTDPLAFRLRVAQSHVRHDMTPSWWSHAVLLGSPQRNLTLTDVYEISLDPPQGFGFPPSTNGVRKTQFRRYEDHTRYPNIAVFRIPGISRTALMEALARFQSQRAVLDGLDLILRWLAFGWGVGKSENPLLEGQGIPSAAMLDVIFSAVGFELTPSLESRASCPESIWQAAKWWHQYYKQAPGMKIPRGYYCLDHALWCEV